MKLLHIGPGKLVQLSKNVKPVISGIAPALSAYGLMKSQLKLGYKVAFLNSQVVPSNMGIEKVSGVTFIDGISKRHLNPWHISNIWIDKILSKFGKPDLINIHGVYNPFQNALALKFKKMNWPYVFVAHGGLGIYHQNQRKLKKTIANYLWFNKFVHNAAAVRVLCQAEKNNIKPDFKPKKVILAPNAISKDLFDQATQVIPACDIEGYNKNKDILLGFVGRIDVYNKGLDVLLEAIHLFNNESKETKLKLFIMGPYYRPEDETMMNKLLNKFNLFGDVSLVGTMFGKAKSSYVLACDVFCYPSRFEGLPMSPLEAMALGKPCLVTPGSNVGDIVTRVDGWVSELEPKSIYCNLKEIVRQKNSLKDRGLKARNLMLKEFTWDKVASKLKFDEEQIICEYCKD